MKHKVWITKGKKAPQVNLWSYHPIFSDYVRIKDDGATLTITRASMFDRHKLHKAAVAPNGKFGLGCVSEIPYGVHPVKDVSEDCVVVTYNTTTTNADN